MSSNLKLEGKLDQLKGRIKETWGNVTDDDFKRAEGKADRLIGIIKERTGESRDKIRRRLDDMNRD